MNKEQQRIKIAEACGQGCHHLRNLPDYLNDLNAMHEAKKALWAKDWAYRHMFNDYLANIIKGRIVNRNEWDAETLLDATAAQRAEAFLRTLNLWEE
jgi:hypothetical protein